VWTLDADTLPANTLTAIDAVIDPLRTAPGSGLPSAVTGTRYLLVNDLGPSVAWGSLTAQTNDIVEFNGTWSIAFDASAMVKKQYVLNLYTNRQLYWNGKEWLLSIDTFYHPGMWRVSL